MNYNELINHEFSFVFFSLKECKSCDSNKLFFEKLSEKYTNSIFTQIDLAENENAKGYFSVFTVPTLIVYSHGKEIIREARFFNYIEIESKLTKNYKMIFE